MCYLVSVVHRVCFEHTSYSAVQGQKGCEAGTYQFISILPSTLLTCQFPYTGQLTTSSRNYQTENVMANRFYKKLANHSFSLFLLFMLCHRTAKTHLDLPSSAHMSSQMPMIDYSGLIAHKPTLLYVMRECLALHIFNSVYIFTLFLFLII